MKSQVDIDILKGLKKLQCELMVTSGGLLLKGRKLIILKKLQDKTVELAQKVWFPGVDTLVEKKVKSCIVCQASTHPPKSYVDGTSENVKTTRWTMAKDRN